MKGINKGPLAKGEREDTHHTQQIRTRVKGVNRRHQSTEGRTASSRNHMIEFRPFQVSEVFARVLSQSRD